MSDSAASAEAGLKKKFGTPRLYLPIDPSIWMMVGRPKSGKSWAIRSIMERFSKERPFAFGKCWCGSAFTGDYNWLPANRVSGEFTLDKLKAYVEGMRKLILDNKAKDPKWEMPRNFIILDDLLGQLPHYDLWVLSWLACYRKTNTSVFISAQYLAQGSSTLLRASTNLAFMWYETNLDAIENLYKNYGQMMPGKKKGDKFMEFQAVLRATTQNDDKKYRCLVYVNGKNSACEAFFAWTALPVPDDFKMKC